MPPCIFTEVSKMKKARIRIICFAVAVIIVFAACAAYLGNYYKTDTALIQAFLPQGASWETEPGGNIIFEPENAKTGFIFYPGGKVEYTSYIPLMQALSEKGILCVLAEMPFNLAVFGINAAEGIRQDYPQTESWYIGGHSLGGAMAASWLENNATGFDGLILLGSYSTVDFSRSDISVLSVYGSEDKVLNKEKYNECKINLPENFTEYVIEGGCHAYFGMYGAQEGDGNPTITNEEQIRITAEKIAEFVGNKK